MDSALVSMLPMMDGGEGAFPQRLRKLFGWSFSRMAYMIQKVILLTGQYKKGRPKRDGQRKQVDHLTESFSENLMDQCSLRRRFIANAASPTPDISISAIHMA